MLRSVYSHMMDTFTLILFLGLSLGSMVKAVEGRCPADYRKRVETCIMEAQLAPQAGGGITLVLKKDTIVALCDRGILRKTIDCLEEIHSRCLHNTSVIQELDRLYSVPRWEQGEQLLCRDTQLFQNNYDCLFRSASSVTSCILMRTHTFRMGLAFTDPSDHASIRDVTCSFAESIVKCICSPLESHCPIDMTIRVAGTMRLFLPPYCLDDTDSYIKTTLQRETTSPDTLTNKGNPDPPDYTTKQPEPALPDAAAPPSEPTTPDEGTKAPEPTVPDDTRKGAETVVPEGLSSLEQ